MSDAWRTLRWDRVDAFTRGPLAAGDVSAPVSFEVPGSPAPGFAFGRLAAGDGWPAEAPRIARRAAVPIPVAPEGGTPGSVVLSFESDAGDAVPLCWRTPDGGVRWSVDPEAWICGLLLERYVVGWHRPLPSRLRGFNYSRLPRRLKGWLQSAMYSPPRDNPLGFPELPVDALVETLRELCFVLCHGSAPSTAGLWPEGRRAAVTLTHDLDSGWIFDPRRAPVLREIVERETSLGFRGAWYIVGDCFEAARHADAVDLLLGAGHEFGLHGWNHDAKLAYVRPARQARRLRRARERAARWPIEGIRTPWYSRTPELFEAMSRVFAYDTSVPNASPIFSGGSNSGSCTLFPYRPVRGLVELPLTLPPDDYSAPRDDYGIRRRVADAIVSRGGVVVVTVHPEPHQSASDEPLALYFEFLEALARDYGDDLWHATPGDVVRHYTARLAARGPAEPEK